MYSDVDHVTADTVYDANKIYSVLEKKFHNIDIVIPPKKGSIYNKKIQCYGRMSWQDKHHYGRRNQSECAMGRYKRILGNKLHAREFSRQRQEAILVVVF